MPNGRVPRLGSLDRLFWVTLRRLWSGWRKPLVVVTPETVVSARAAASITDATDQNSGLMGYSHIRAVEISRFEPG